jgi:MFS family permease
LWCESIVPTVTSTYRITDIQSSYYVTSVLQLNVGLDRNLSLLLGGVINAMFFVGSLLPALALDRLGRRRPMMWGSFGLGVSMMMIAILLSFQDRGGSIAKATSSASIAFFFTVSSADHQVT